uniref:Lipid droplet associated hydrolase n=2 Tax=Cyprinus carpio TaxID=7962 RepID=A0A8C1AYP3_CYPCA
MCLAAFYSMAKQRQVFPALVMLFPTIEGMACRTQGKVMTPVLCLLRYTFYLPIFLLSLLPERLKLCLHCLIYYSFVTSNGMYMGSQEMRLVVERDNVTIRQHLSKLIFYYGAMDHWCPVQYYNDIRKDFPEGDIRLCERGPYTEFLKKFADFHSDLLVTVLTF